MATLLHSESRRLYSWWWDSHNTPKNSKWLQENLTDMDAKVKAMIKLIEEDADSFARRAEMYYKKRPELMKLVEEFYRAYRALAERYNHATVELRQVHRTMEEAFPNQVPIVLADDDSPSSFSCPNTEPHTPDMRHHIRSPFELSSANLHALKRNGGYSEESNPEISKMGLKQLHDMFGSGGVLQTQALSDSQHALEAETEVQTLKKTIAEILAEKDAIFLQFQQSLEKLSDLERRQVHAHDDAEGLDEQENRAEVEIKVLKEGLAKLEAEKDDAHLQQKECIDKISSLETMLSVAKEDAEGLNERAWRAEREAQNLREKIFKMEAENEAGEFQYNQCLEKISVLEAKLSLAVEDARMLKEQSELAEIEVNALKEALAKLNEEKEVTAVLYKQCLESKAKMESELLHAKEDAERLNREVLKGAARLKSVDELSVQLEISNHSLQSEADQLARDIAMKDFELSQKQDELEKLKLFAQEDHTRLAQIEATLHILQTLHSQSQDKQRALALELENELQMLKDLKSDKHSLEEEIKRVTEENQSLNEMNSSSTSTIQSLQNEISTLKGVKEKHEEEYSLQAEASSVLHQEICKLNEEIKDLSSKYRGLVAEMESVGITPDELLSSLVGLQDENSKLKEICKREAEEREVCYEKLKDMDNVLEENAGLGRSLSEVNVMLEGSREKVKEMQESCQVLQGEKSSLVAEKGNLLSQLHTITGNMQMLLEKNSLLENSLCGANVELEGLRVKSKYLEEFYQLLTHEKSNLLNERNILVSQLENAEQRLRNLENRYSMLEEKCAGLEIEKQNASCQVQELQCCLSMEKQEHVNYLKSNEVRLADLEDHVQLLQEESRLSKKEFEEQLAKAVKSQVEIFILQKFIKELEEKNSSILIECRKHVAASELSDKLIAELETENLEQRAEVEFLLDEIEKLRLGIHQVFRALQMVPDNRHENWAEQEQIPLSLILDDIKVLKSSLLSSNDDKQQLLIENSVLLTLLEQLRLEGSELVSEKTILKQEFHIMTEQRAMLQKDKHELLDMNRQLRMELSKGELKEVELKAEIESLFTKLADLEGAYQLLQEENSKVLTENSYLQKEFSDMKEEMSALEEENIDVLHENIALSNLSLVFKSFGDEKIAESRALIEDLNRHSLSNAGLMEEIRELRRRLEMKEEEFLCLNESANILKKELDDVQELNGTLDHQLSVVKDFLRHKETELSDVVEKLEATKNFNIEFCKVMEELKNECEKSKLVRENIEKQILDLSEDNTNQNREIEHLREVNGNMESEMGALFKEVEKSRTREEQLSLELQERSNEFELWEAEAATFYFDMQTSSVQELLLEDKIQELTRVSGNLEEESATKSAEIEQMKGRVNFLENEVGGLKAELSAYAPAIASLRDDITSLENNALQRKRHSLSINQQQEDMLMAIHSAETSSQDLRVDLCAPNGISDLQKMQARIREVEKVVVEEMKRLEAQKSSSTTIKLEATVQEKSDDTIILKEKSEVGVQLADRVKSKKTKPEVSEVRNGVLIRDIPLDHVSNCSLYGTSRRRDKGSDDRMLELWETVEQDRGLSPMVNGAENDSMCHRFGCLSQELQVEKELAVDKLEVLTSSTEPNQERKILEELASDAKKLINLQATILDMKKKIETSKNTKNNKHVEYETVELHIRQVDEAVVELVGVNEQLKKTIAERPSRWGPVESERVSEEARKESEKITQLQFEVQNIQYVMLKLEDEKKSRGKNKFHVSKAGVFWSIFLLGESRSSGKRKKSRFCGCMRPATNSN